MYQLKNVKEYKALSEETIAFSANLYKNNKKVASCRNDGRGGCNDVDWESESERQSFTQYISKQPSETIQFGNESMELMMSEDMFISNLLHKYLEKKDDENQIKKSIKKGYQLVIKEISDFRVTYHSGNNKDQAKAILNKPNTYLIYGSV